MPYERANKFTRHDEKSIYQFAQTRFPSEQRGMIFIFYFWNYFLLSYYYFIILLLLFYYYCFIIFIFIIILLLFYYLIIILFYLSLFELCSLKCGTNPHKILRTTTL